ncbi:hypothetical protein CASFOL_003021 [Castilleja foliolosa]|uniref:MORF/ORRM1/DAG-like MORF domain-containing protein n=1 Tax=Castilleja foliolosa TaxID=1961234 RepID=A0ABD3EFY7_9LAMI
MARAQVGGYCKRLFSGISIHRPPHPRVSSSQITGDDNDKFWFLDAVEGRPWPGSFFNRWHIFIKRSCLKGATQEEKMDFYVKTAAQILGSNEEEAKERIYKVTVDCSYDGFGLQIGFDRMHNYQGLRSIIDKEILEKPVFEPEILLLKARESNEPWSFLARQARLRLDCRAEPGSSASILLYGLHLSFNACALFGSNSSSNHAGWLTIGTVCFNDGELIRWSLISKRREKGRFPLPIPDSDTESDLDD